ncbi:peptide-methionine (R)-S-oxide reductase MsrB [Candidatus Pacearchaeota archaeon]|nr:peptide-methionine (R)-S-oxide reductase MsrB [Candidatus Pacearchaeota archaeon]
MKESEIKKKLTPEQYHILREKGTEPAFSGKYWNHNGSGDYTCAVCNSVLFRSDTKFDSGTGWPSFTNPSNTRAVEIKEDTSHGMHRVEVRCKKCKSHLGHVFPDGPEGKSRYCINSACLVFKKR